MKKLHIVNVIKSFVIIAAMIVSWSLVGCKTAKLESGGAYSPTNSLGQVIYNDKALALADATYKFAYETTLSVFDLERENRAAIWAISTDIKTTLDHWRPQVDAINKKWAQARKLYKANPTPAGLSTIQTLIAEMVRVLPIVEAQLPQIYAVVTKPQP